MPKILNPKISINFLHTKKTISNDLVSLLKKTVSLHTKRACRLLNVPLVNVSIYCNKKFVIPETGEGGYAFTKDWYHVYIDPSRKQAELKKIIEKQIPGTVYHEMNHVARNLSVGYGSSLLEATVSEGMACFFEEETWSDSKMPWCKYSDKEIKTLLKLMQKRIKLNDNLYNHNEWFYGSGKLPRWISYKIGHYIIKEYKEKNKGNINWGSTTRIPSTNIIRQSKVSL